MYALRSRTSEKSGESATSREHRICAVECKYVLKYIKKKDRARVRAKEREGEREREKRHVNCRCLLKSKGTNPYGAVAKDAI